MSGGADLVQLARRLGWIAQNLDVKGYQFTGPIRDAARLLLDLPEREAPDADCAGCEAPLVQPATGRRRKWCSESCRSKARRR